MRNIGDQGWLEPNNVNVGWHSEYVLGTVHTGTHIDALGHFTCGHDDLFHGGGSSNRELGDFGLLEGDATELPTLLTRGVLIDVPAALGVPYLNPSQQIGRADIEAALTRQKVDIRKGDTVLVRTGYLSGWPDQESLARTRQAGINLEAGEFLLDQGAVVVGGDTETLECLPSGIVGDPMPVHRKLLIENGIYIMEMVYVEELARDGVYEFLFICLPLKIKGATGSMARPVAII
jgi:kynurenine formamidase